MRKRPYIRREWCIRVIQSPLRAEPQDTDRWRFWGVIPELEGSFLRVVTFSDKLTHTERISRPAIQTMKLNYYPETDSLYIDLSAGTSVDSVAVSEGVVLDYDAKVNLVGIDIDEASRKLDLSEVITSRVPILANA